MNCKKKNQYGTEFPPNYRNISSHETRTYNFVELIPVQIILRVHHGISCLLFSCHRWKWCDLSAYLDVSSEEYALGKTSRHLLWNLTCLDFTKTLSSSSSGLCQSLADMILLERKFYSCSNWPKFGSHWYSEINLL